MMMGGVGVSYVKVGQHKVLLVSLDKDSLNI